MDGYGTVKELVDSLTSTFLFCALWLFLSSFPHLDSASGPHGCRIGTYSHCLNLVSPFRSLARPSLPSALLSLTLAPSGLSLSYFLRPHPIVAPLDPPLPLPHQRFLAGRFVPMGTVSLQILFFSFAYLYLLHLIRLSWIIIFIYCFSIALISFPA